MISLLISQKIIRAVITQEVYINQPLFNGRICFFNAGDCDRLDLGSTGLGNVLAMGSERNLVTHHLVYISRPNSSEDDGWLAWQEGCSNGYSWFCCSPFYLMGSNVSAGRCA